MEGIAGLEGKLADSAWLSARTALSAFDNPQVLATAEAPVRFRPAMLRDGKPRTLYLVGPPLDQTEMSPIALGLLHELLTDWIRHASRRPPGGWRPEERLLAVLDEAANIAPLRELPQLASTAGGLGLTLLVVLQDLSALRELYGPRAGSVFANLPAKLLCGGMTDPQTLRDFREVLGEEWVETTSHSTGEGRVSVSTGLSRAPTADQAVLRTLPPGEALLLCGGLSAQVRLLDDPNDPGRRLTTTHPRKPRPARSCGGW